MLRTIKSWFKTDSVHLNLSTYQAQVELIKNHSKDLNKLNDAELKVQFLAIQTKVKNGSNVEEFLVEIFALVLEASDRVLDMRLFDVQIIAGLILHGGNILQMQTGEGKTLAGVAPVILNALTGNGVHILTFNDYLAKRDALWMAPIYQFFDFSVGFIQEGMTTLERKKSYDCDITYATAKEVGFDYLNDQIQCDPKNLMQREFNFVVVDEADSLLIDEARVPLILSGSVKENQTDSTNYAELIKQLSSVDDYDVDENERNIFLTDKGADKVEKILKCGNLYDASNLALIGKINTALHVSVLLLKDRDYIVRNGIIEAIDEFTGRVVKDRRWPDNMQAALEEKESLHRQDEGIMLGTITLQHFVALYEKVSGMTGTAISAADEFKEFYDLETWLVPTHRVCQRIDEVDLIFSHQQAKDKALLKGISTLHKLGRPILVGTASVTESERLGKLLKDGGIGCEILNAKNDEYEAPIIAAAGGFGKVTICTNIAGRGTDIVLGPDSEEEHDRIVALGGLYVIGTNRHESRRIDDQLRGRSGRQGDPGSSRFYLSLEDDLINRFGIHEVLPAQHCLKKQDEVIDHPIFHKKIAYVQRVIEGQNLDIRKNLCKYSSLLEQQQQFVQSIRTSVLLNRVNDFSLKNSVSSRWNLLLVKLGANVLKTVERQITLFCIDEQWTQHLALVRDVRESSSLYSVGATEFAGLTGSMVGESDPYDHYAKSIHTAFLEMINLLEEMIVNKFMQVDITKEGINLEKEGLIGPSSTWTYLVTDDAFSGDLKNGLVRRVKKLISAHR